MISIPLLNSASSQGSRTAAATRSTGTDANLFAQLLKARLDSAMFSLGMDETSSSGGTSGLMDMMLLGSMMQPSSSGGLDSTVLTQLIEQLKQPAAQSEPAAPGAQSRQGGVYISRVYTPDIAPGATWPQHSFRHQNVAVSALTRVGDPYSQSRRGQGSYVDCSYLTQWAYGQNGISIPSIASEQARWCVENGYVIPKSDLQIGDLVFWNRDDCACGRYDEIHHVGIYLGDGQVIEASSSQGKVVVNDLWGSEDAPWHLAFFARPAA